MLMNRHETTCDVKFTDQSKKMEIDVVVKNENIIGSLYWSCIKLPEQITKAQYRRGNIMLNFALLKLHLIFIRTDFHDQRVNR